MTTITTITTITTKTTMITITKMTTETAIQNQIESHLVTQGGVPIIKMEI